MDIFIVQRQNWQNWSEGCTHDIVKLFNDIDKAKVFAKKYLKNTIAEEFIYNDGTVDIGKIDIKEGEDLSDFILSVKSKNEDFGVDIFIEKFKIGD